MKELTVTATVENLDVIQEALAEFLETAECSPKAQFELEVAVEEIFVNICSYAYRPGVGPAVVRFETTPNPLNVKITFVDNGIPFDPLKKAEADPDALLADEDAQGGLGIFMVRQSMDEVKYEYKDGQNILSIKKSL